MPLPSGLAWLMVSTCAQDSLTSASVQAFNDLQSVPLLPYDWPGCWSWSSRSLVNITVSPNNSRPEPQHTEELQTCRRSTTRRACRCCPLVGHKLAWLTAVSCAQDSLTQLGVQAFNDPQSVPLLPNELAWLMELVKQVPSENYSQPR